MGRRDLVEAAARGDHDAFASLARADVDRLYGTAFLILRDRDRAEDAVQETLVRSWRQLGRLRDPDRYDAWLMRMLVNACYDEGRRLRRHPEVRLLPTHEIPSDDPSQIVLDREQLVRGFRRIPVEQRAVLVLGHHLGFSQQEIADALGIPIGTVKSRMRYALDAMRASLDADDRVAGRSSDDDRRSGRSA